MYNKIGTTKSNAQEIEKLKQQLKNLPTESLAEKLGIPLTNLHGPCPIGHKSESEQCFSINTTDNYWYCFNCGTGGDNIELVITKLAIDFKEAIEWLATNFNVNHSVNLSNVPELSLEEKEEQRKLQVRGMLYEKAFAWMHELLFKPEGKEALDYLINDRRYNTDALKNSEFCFFPETQKVRDYLLQEFPDAKEEIKSLPLNGFYRDNFRLAIPYRNKKKLITGFLKRATSSSGITIIIDSKVYNDIRWDSTAGLSKSDLFNLHNCKEQETIIVLEGYPDAVYFTAIGMENICAVGQGKLSRKHLESLSGTKVKHIIVSFDNDAVGVDNTEGAVKLILEESEIKPFVLDPSLLGLHKDPDEFVRANGIETFNALLKKAESGVKWVVNGKLNHYGEEDALQNAKIQDEILELCKLIKDPIELDYISEKVVTTFGSSKNSIKSLIKERQKEHRIQSYQKIKNEKVNSVKRYFPFIEKNTSSYAYWDSLNDTNHLGIPKEILENILTSAEQVLPEVIPVLKANFDVHINDRYDVEKEIFNLFVPSPYHLLSKNDEWVNPKLEFPNTLLLLKNLFPEKRELKLFLNWLAGILQTREKQLTAWVLKGKPGSGKGLLLNKILKPLLGERQAVQIENDQLGMSWNPWLQNSVLIAFNEVAQDKNTSNSIESKCKAIVSDPEIMINDKHIKTFYVTNYVNCLFFSNKTVPIFIEPDDRRYNVVETGPNLRTYSWFSSNPEAFIDSLKSETSAFARFLINWKYDPIKAKTCINNVVKESMISLGMNKFEEFATQLKNKNLDWFENNVSSNFPATTITQGDIDGKIMKSQAVNIFNAIYTNQTVSDAVLAKQLKLYGIVGKKLTIEGVRQNYFVWE